MKLTTNEITCIAALISNQILCDLEEKLKYIKESLTVPKLESEIETYDRRKVAKIFNITRETLTEWVKAGIIGKGCYQVINGRYKFFKEKIDELLHEAKAGTWEPTRRYHP